MSINLEFIDIQLLSVTQDSISEITDLFFSTYDSNGILLIPPKDEDRLTAQIKSYPIGKKEYEEFIRNGIERAVIRGDPSLLKCLTNQYHLFIPVNVANLKLVFVSNPFYLEINEFEDFLTKKGHQFGLSISHLESWSKIIKIKDHSSVQKTAVHIKSLLETALRSNYERNLNDKKYRWTKTLIDVLFDVKLPVHVEEVYSLVIDAILFLFNVDTVAIMVKEKNFFRTVMASGKLKDNVQFLYMKKDDNPMISRAIENCSMVSTNNVAEISMLGFPDTITAIYIFPLVYRTYIHGAVAIYNSIISSEESCSILEFCKLVSLVLKNLTLQNAYNKYIDDMEVLNMAVTKLTPQLHNLDALYKAIVDTATELLKAEKGSFMLPEDDSLIIKAIKGTNRWLIQDIRIKKGEGIAGNVFKNGNPLFAEDMKKVELPDIKPRSRYKTGSFISVPIKFGYETMGVLNISDKTTGEEFTERDLNLISHFASYASIALKVCNYYNLAEQMKELSITDPLTELFNRRYFQERFTEEILRSERYGGTFSLAMFDVDDLKLLNDTEGHLVGDNILKELAQIAHERIRANDILSRFGGDEFAVIMPYTCKEDAVAVVERMRRSIKESLVSKWRKFPRPGITVSIGIASFPDDGKSVNELIESADAALYKAKSTGGDRTIIYRGFK
jgi:diguanylate cyclase (GGDEF)-like protein